MNSWPPIPIRGIGHALRRRDNDALATVPGFKLPVSKIAAPEELAPCAGLPLYGHGQVLA